MPDLVALKSGLILVALLGAGLVRVGAFGTLMPAASAAAAGQSAGREAGAGVADSPLQNPHSDLIFRASGATSCRDCHRIEKNGSLSTQTIDNDLVRTLREKAKSIHGPGRFADCLRCHAGGSKGVEKYGTAR